MMRRLALLAAIAMMIAAPLAAAPAWAQDTGCASSLWLSTGGAPAPAAQAWMSSELTDACTGQAFSLSGFTGKTVYVETMATWCTNCHAQLSHLRDAVAQLTPEQQQNIVVVALSLETDLSSQALAEYAAFNDFPFVFAVMPVEMVQAMAGDLGQEVTVAPATPHLLVYTDGTVGPLRTGIEPAADLLALFASAGI